MKISMIGAGQQGVSQGLAYARLDRVAAVTFHDPFLERDVILDKARQAGIDSAKLVFAGTIAEAVRDADIIALNMPMSEFEACACAIALSANADAIIYDNGSGKVQAIEDVRAGLKQSSTRYVPLHILEGRAGSGAATADVNMYRNSTAAIIADDADIESVEIMSGLLRDIGIGTVRTDLSAQKHDEALGRFSHHNTFYQMTLMRAFPNDSIGGQDVAIEPFLSSTRVAKSGSVEHDGSAMWAPIARDNKNAILAAAESVHANLVDLSAAIEQGKYAELGEKLAQAKAYVSKIKEARVIEDVEGALYDLGQIANGAEAAYIGSHVAAPVIFAAASALGAHDYEQAGGEPYRSINNPSFRDTVRPANATPEKIARLVEENTAIVQSALEKLIDTHAELLAAIACGNETVVRTHIHEANELRHRLPAHNANGRPRFSI